MSQQESIGSTSGQYERDGWYFAWGDRYFRCRLTAWVRVFSLGTLLAIIGAALVYVCIEPQYEASSLLQIHDTTPYIVNPPDGGSQQFVQTQIELIRSPLVLGPALVAPIKKWNAEEHKWVETEQRIASLPELQEQDAPIEWLREEIRVTQVGKSELYQISFSSANGENAANIVNAVTDAYFALREKEDSKLSQRMLQLLEDERASREMEITRLRHNVNQKTEELGLAAGSRTKEDVSDDFVGQLRENLLRAETDLRILEVQIEALQDVLEQPVEVSDAIVEEELDSDPFLQELRTVIDQKRVKLIEVETASTGETDDPLAVRLKQEIQRAEEKLPSLRDEQGIRVKLKLEQSERFSRELELADMRAERQSHLATEELLRKKLEGRVAEVTVGNLDSLQLEFMRDELARAKKLYGLIADRAENIRIEGHAGSRVSLLSPAPLPKVPLEPIPYRTMAVVSSVGFCLPLVLMVLWLGCRRVIKRGQPIRSSD